MKFKLPDDISALDAAAIAALVDLALEDYHELKSIEKPSKDEVAAIVQLGADVKTLRDAQKVVEAADAEAEEALAAAVAELEAEPEAEVEPEVEVDPEAEPAEEPADAEVKEPVLASAKPVKKAVLARAAAKTPVVEAELPEEKATPKLAITAAAGIRAVEAGSPVEGGFLGLAKLMQAKAKSIPSGYDGFRSSMIAQMRRPEDPDAITIDDSDSPESAWQKVIAIGAAARRSSFAGLEAITAAAFGWVTPSENFYDLCQWATFSGGLVLPHVNVSRGGMKFIDPTSIDYTTVFNDTNGSFTYTESQLAANPTKPLLTLTVPTWTDVRLDVFGWGLVLPIPLKTTFPELIAWYQEMATIAYQHKFNAAVIQKVLALLPAAVVLPSQGSAASDVLAYFDVIAQATRYKYRLDENAPLQGMAPRWLRTAIKIDLSRRNAYANPFDVTDAQVDGWFRNRGIQLQYVVDWAGQDLVAGQITLPSNVLVGLWVPGTFVQGGDGIIDLSNIYDSARIVKNEYLASFFEESFLVANTCGQGMLYNFGLVLAGASGAQTIGHDGDYS